jgi:hypothetical protein
VTELNYKIHVSVRKPGQPSMDKGDMIMEYTQHRSAYFLLGMVVGTLFGGMIGGLMALWLAPQTGKQLQTRVQKQGKALKRQADEAIAHLSE